MNVFVQEKSIAELIAASGNVDPNDLEIGLRESQRTGESLGPLLVKMGVLLEEDMLVLLAQSLSLNYVRISELTLEKSVLDKVPAKVVSNYNLIPIEVRGNTLVVAINDPLDMHTLDDLRLSLQMEIEPAVATRKEIDDAIKKYYGIGAATVEELMEDREEEAVDLDVGVQDLGDTSEDASIVRFVNQITKEAVADRATDIHIEPFEQELRVRYRIDGMLMEAAVPPSIKRFQREIISRIKILADLNIAERRLPQDGKIKTKLGDKEYDLRVSTVPTPYGESIVIRILSRNSELVSLEKLGLDEHHLKLMRSMIHKPHGILFVTGPTGSGKSTTLYAALSEINAIERKILTVEDPIEYRITGVTQVQVNPQIDLSFARVLRTFLRQDPDVIMVGETRDLETAQAAIRAALTGHMVFSTLHTNDAASAVTRLVEMGIEPFLVSSSVEGLLAQRLVRVLCRHCKQPTTLSADALSQLRMGDLDISGSTFFASRACESCRYSGFLGRTAIYEIIKMNEELKQLVVDRAPANLIRRRALEQGLRPIREDGWHKVQQGLTVIDEVLRVTLEDEFA